MGGHLVVSRDTEPAPHYHFLLNVLVQQTGVALVNARLHTRERASAERERAIADELRAVSLALERAMTELARSSAAVQRSLDIHNRLTTVASAHRPVRGQVICITDPKFRETIRQGTFLPWPPFVTERAVARGCGWDAQRLCS